MSHREGQTIQIFRGDGYVFDGPRTDYGLWGRSTGEPLGVTFGDRFIQMGRSENHNHRSFLSFLQAFYKSENDLIS